jgi:lysyl-tRNA synthetase, class II
LIQDLIQTLAREVVGSLTLARAEGGEIHLDGPWREVTYQDLVREATGDPDWFSRPTAEKRDRAATLGLHPEPHWEDYEITNDVYTKKVEPSLIQPTFVTRLPRELIPLAKACPDDPSCVEVFELCINGQEIAPAYSEQNDPLAQRAALEAQAGEEIQKVDEDFLLALEHGMPPAGGLGLGVDRLCILLTGAASIRDVILFPSLRPSAREGT